MEAITSFYESMYDNVMHRLRIDLNIKYLYHDSRHTQDVIRQCQEIGYREGVTPAEIALHKERGRSQMEPGGLLDPNKHKTIFERRSGNDGAEPV